MARYQVQPNKTIRRGNQRFIARGSSMFDTIFCGFDFRTDYLYRTGSVAGSGISATTHYAPSVYGPGGSIMRQQLDEAYKANINLLRVCVEPAMLKASVPILEPLDGNTYPAEIDMLDTIIAEADKRDMVVLLTSGQSMTTLAQDQAFWAVIAARYKDKENVWLNPLNEIGCYNGDPNCSLPNPWALSVAARVATMRSAGFTNPIVINPPEFGFRVDIALPALLGNPTFSTDPNLIIGVHQYYQGAAFSPALAGSTWANYMDRFCVLIEEVGIDCYPGRSDPNLEAWTPSVDLPRWAAMQQWARDFLTWAKDLPQLNGIVGTSWNWWQPGTPGVEDDNAMRRHDGSWTTWGTIFRDIWLSPPLAGAGQTAVSFPINIDGITYANRTYRICIPAAKLNSFGPRCRLTFQGASAGAGATIHSVYVGTGAYSSGDVYDFDHAPTLVTFGGSATVTVPVGGSIASDVVSCPVQSGLPLVVSFVMQNTCTMAYGMVAGVSEYYKDGPDSAAINASGYLFENYLSILLSKVEVYQ